MQCPNCRSVEDGQWLFCAPSGGAPMDELLPEEYRFADEAEFVLHQEEESGGGGGPFFLDEVVSALSCLPGATLCLACPETCSQYSSECCPVLAWSHLCPACPETCGQYSPLICRIALKVLASTAQVCTVVSSTPGHASIAGFSRVF